MRLLSARGKPALLTYCANVHPGETLDDVLRALRRFAGPVRRRLGVAQLGVGLWLGRGALDQLRAAAGGGGGDGGGGGAAALRAALQEEGLFVFTLNGFPYGNFHAEVVK